MKKLKILTGVMLLTLQGAHAQQQASSTLYMFNVLAINPAYAGNAQGMEFNLTAREQWVGFEGAPSTQTFTANYSVPDQPIGLGLSIINDKIGLASETGFSGAYSYELKLTDNGRYIKNGHSIVRGSRLTLGLQGGLTRFRWGLSQVASSLSTIDNTFQRDEVRSWMFNFGAGALFSTEHVFVGLSAPSLINNYYDREVGSSRKRNHYFFHAGAELDLNRDIEFIPSALVRVVRGAPMEIDANLFFNYQRKIGGGISYRALESIGLVVQAQVLDHWKIGYGYDMLTNDIRKVSGGSHEIMISYTLFWSGIHHYVHPRFF